MPKKLTTEEFIKRAREVHGDRYDYSRVIYINKRTKVTIICREHGEFEQEAGSHLMGIGCGKCNYTISASKKKLTTEGFIKRVRKVHGNRYDYSKVKYDDSKTRVIIICREHGEFEQLPFGHLYGQGCPKCSKYYKQKITTEEFIKRAREIHGDRYDYSKVDYVNSKTRVIIICPKHGEFEQISSNHLIGQGCPKCNRKGLNYLSYDNAKNFIKNYGFKSHLEYWKWWDENKPDFLPRNPHMYY